MQNNPDLKENLDIKFNLNELAKIEFGKLEGERDNLLESCFFPTRSVQKYLSSPINYVLSPKGAGKSALFRSITSNFIQDYLFAREEYSIISINNAFGFNDEDYLDVDKFREESRMKLTISWGLFILSKLIDDIITNHSKEDGYKDLINDISQIKELKEKFSLYKFKDYLESISTSIKFVANGQEFEVSPTFNLEEKPKKINLNQLFYKVNEFYKGIGKKALILIDRIDNFVQKEEYEIQKKYIQGLFDCIEEVSLLDNIVPSVFLRTDLFYSYESDIEYDKVKDRTIELEWDTGETLTFIVFRLISNDYINKNFRQYLFMFYEEAREGKHRTFQKKKFTIKSWVRSFFNNVPKLRIDTNRPLDYTISEKFLKIFFPGKIHSEEDDILVDFCDWIFKYLKDANGFVNPRLLIHFFNVLFEKQNFIQKNHFPDKSELLSPNQNTSGLLIFEIFTYEAFQLAFEQIQLDELKNIYTLLKTRTFKKLFLEINKVSLGYRYFRYGDINIKRMDIDKKTYDSLIKYLKLLGYFYEVENQKYNIPPIYRAELSVGP